MACPVRRAGIGWADVVRSLLSRPDGVSGSTGYFRSVATLTRFDLPAIVLTLDYVNYNAAPKVRRIGNPHSI